MGEEINRRIKERVFESVLLSAACIAICSVLFLSFMAVKNLSTCYQELVNADLTKDYSGSVYYDDHMYVVLGKGLVLDDTAAISDRPAIMASFLKETLFYIDERIFAAGMLYAMMISVIALYPLAKRNSRYIRLLSPLIYAVYLVFEILAHAALSVPFYFLNGSGIIKILSGMIAVSAGTCAASLLIRRVRYQKITSILIIPAVFFLFIMGMYLEFGMYNPKTVESFDYVYSADSRIIEEGYYDSDKNVLIFEDKEYPPEQAENPEHYTGVKYLGASLLETLYPYSGSSLYMVEQAMEHEISLAVYMLYTVKGLIWVFFSKRGADKTVL